MGYSKSQRTPFGTTGKEGSHWAAKGRQGPAQHRPILWEWIGEPGMFPFFSIAEPLSQNLSNWKGPLKVIWSNSNNSDHLWDFPSSTLTQKPDAYNSCSSRLLCLSDNHCWRTIKAFILGLFSPVLVAFWKVAPGSFMIMWDKIGCNRRCLWYLSELSVFSSD